MQCCICGHDDAVPVGVGEDFEYHCSADQFLAMQCRECGLVYLKLRPAMSELSRVYPPNYHAFDFSSERYGLAHRVRRRLEARRLLSAGGRAAGREPHPRRGLRRRLSSRAAAASSARPSGASKGWTRANGPSRRGNRAGSPFTAGRLQDVGLTPSSYDLALLIATIEHVDDPPGVLRAVHALLRPGGRVLVVTDNTASPSFPLFAGRHWGGYHFPRHWNLFDARNLELLAGRTGFEIERITTIVTPVNWTYSLHNALVDWGAPRWLVNRFTLASPVSLGVFTLVDGLLQLAGRGGLLRAVLCKPPAARSGAEDGPS